MLRSRHQPFSHTETACLIPRRGSGALARSFHIAASILKPLFEAMVARCTVSRSFHIAASMLKTRAIAADGIVPDCSQLPHRCVDTETTESGFVAELRAASRSFHIAASMLKRWPT